LYVSRINKPKRQDVLIKAWKNFSENYPEEKLIIAGSDENKKFLDEIKNLAENSKNISIKTDLNENELLELYSNCKAVIFVPFLEDFGIVPFEAMALGKPLIAVEKGGYSRLIEKFDYYKIKELYSEKEMIKEINLVLEEFMKSKKKTRKIQSIGNNTQNFIKKIEEALLQ
jgi:glycosyltransferase involved in cell wall biosynthesis